MIETLSFYVTLMAQQADMRIKLWNLKQTHTIELEMEVKHMLGITATTPMMLPFGAGSIFIGSGKRIRGLAAIGMILVVVTDLTL